MIPTGARSKLPAAAWNTHGSAAPHSAYRLLQIYRWMGWEQGIERRRREWAAWSGNSAPASRLRPQRLKRCPRLLLARMLWIDKGPDKRIGKPLLVPITRPPRLLNEHAIHIPTRIHPQNTPRFCER